MVLSVMCHIHLAPRLHPQAACQALSDWNPGAPWLCTLEEQCSHPASRIRQTCTPPPAVWFRDEYGMSKMNHWIKVHCAITLWPWMSLDHSNGPKCEQGFVQGLIGSQVYTDCPGLNWFSMTGLLADRLVVHCMPFCIPPQQSTYWAWLWRLEGLFWSQE